MKMTVAVRNEFAKQEGYSKSTYSHYTDFKYNYQFIISKSSSYKLSKTEKQELPEPSIKSIASLYKDNSQSEKDKEQLSFGNAEISIDVGEKSFTLPKALNLVAEQIEEAKEILDYPLDWDEEGALPTDKETFVEAVSFIVSYALWIYKNYDEIIKPPYIDLMKDGAVSVHWETENAQLLIIFNKAEDFRLEEEKLAHFYAERKENRIPLKSAIKPGAEIDEFIGLWMKKNLT